MSDDAILNEQGVGSGAVDGRPPKTPEESTPAAESAPPTLPADSRPATGARSDGPAYRCGPNVTAIVIGLIGLVTSALVFAHQLFGLDLTDRAVLPVVVLTVGGLCVAAGLIGLIRSAFSGRCPAEAAELARGHRRPG